MIQKHLQRIQILWMIFTIILMITTQQEKEKFFYIVFDDMTVNFMTNKKFQAIIKELFIRCRKLNICCIYHTIIFLCSKRSQIKFYTLPNNEDL